MFSVITNTCMFLHQLLSSTVHYLLSALIIPFILIAGDGKGTVYVNCFCSSVSSIQIYVYTCI